MARSASSSNLRGSHRWPYATRSGGVRLRSPAFEAGGRLPARFSRVGDNVSPPLTWSGIPRQAADLVVVCEDLDGAGDGFVHWLLAGIHPSVTGIAEGVDVPAGAAAGLTGYGGTGWDGPGLPSDRRPHRLRFVVVASSVELRVEGGFTRSDLRSALNGQELASAELVALFQA